MNDGTREGPILARFAGPFGAMRQSCAKPPEVGGRIKTIFSKYQMQMNGKINENTQTFV
ncbi:hypothetical protein ACFOSW_13285 [Paenibacillus sp. GCM10012303]